MSSGQPAAAAAAAAGDTYVTLGDSPTCEGCGIHYAERECEDCQKYLCTWCNIDVHMPIGKRNHHRPRLYGVDPQDHLNANAISTAERSLAQLYSGDGADGNASSSSSQGSGASSRPVQMSIIGGRVQISTETPLPVSSKVAWDVLGPWDCPYLPFSVDVNDADDRRVISLPSQSYDDSASTSSSAILVTEKLIDRDDDSMFYSYSRLVPPGAGYVYSDMTSRFEIIELNPPSRNKSILRWTTTVRPNEGVEPIVAAEDVTNFQESYVPFFNAAFGDIES